MGESLVKPNRPAFTSVEALAALVTDGDVFGVGGHHFARLPMRLLAAIAQRGVRDLRYTSWAGGLALEFLLEAGAVASADLCFSSLDIFGLPPRFRAAAESGSLVVRDWTALAMIEAARHRCPDDRIFFMEVQEEGSPRRSFDINFYSAGLRVASVEEPVRRMAAAYAIAPPEIDGLLSRIGGEPLGHLSGGMGRDGRDFATLYFGVAARRGAGRG